MSKYEERIRKKEKELCDLYLKRIKSEYSELPENKRTKILTGLAKLVEIFNMNLEFDEKAVIDLRKKAGLTQNSLAETLKMAQSFISSIECGNCKFKDINNPESQERKYLMYVAKEWGYDPFGLLNSNE